MRRVNHVQDLPASERGFVSGRPSDAHDDLGLRGLIVRDPYATQLLAGEKIWEIRGRPIQIRGLVVIAKAGTGQVYGVANLVRVLGPLELDDLVTAEELPADERDEFRREGLPYDKTYAYVFTKPRRFSRPLDYQHPNGAVTWVRLGQLDLDDVTYDSSAFGTAQRAVG